MFLFYIIGERSTSNSFEWFLIEKWPRNCKGKSTLTKNDEDCVNVTKTRGGGAMTPKFVCIFVRSMYQTSCMCTKQMQKNVFHFQHFIYI